ncbi:unnamed protein product [Pocillopora meandrina]|uniref:Uncharacterized protein n=1 Tax=Pocillopora meandrina TaxID=46732 RepID=A0AAU9XBR6_9CNID|nr:unnamed protein product [Pocillopora meandrina]
MVGSDDKPAIVYDITGFNRSQVVKKLEDIVNDSRYKHKFVFYLGICRVDETLEFCNLFRLKPNPWPKQPGNGEMTVLQDRQFICTSYNQCLVDELNEKYGCKTSLFAEHLEKLFEDNSNIAEYSFVTSEVYILWLFEIARRRVKDSEDATNLKKEYDQLEIDGAITQLIELMKVDSCQFEEIFLKDGTFHCFSGFPSKRQTAIDNIEEKLKSPKKHASQDKDVEKMKQSMSEVYLSEK